MGRISPARPGYLLRYHIRNAAPGLSVLRQSQTSRRGLFSLLMNGVFIMDKQLAALISQEWSNNACRGYLIWAMENCGFSPDDIQRVVSELHYVFDMKSIEEADRHYCDSPY